MRRRHVLGLAPVLLAALSARGAAQPGSTWPSRPIRMLVPFAPGGTTDLMGRLVAEQLGLRLGQPVAVENRPGGGTNIAADAAAKSRPDGYTVLFGAAAMSVNPSLLPSMPYDLFKDLAPVSLVNRTPLVMIVHPDVPARTVQEFVAWAKTQPQGVSYGSGGIGTIPHLAAELLKAEAGINLVHVPYRGQAPAMQDLLAGRLAVMIESVPPILPMIADGRVRAIAVAELRPLSVLPELPTIAEAGYPGFEAAAWNAIWVPAGTPPVIVERLSREVAGIVRTPAVTERFQQLGAFPVGGTPEEMDRFLRAEVARWAEVVKRSGARAD